jgi:RNA polymerase subunit RPABC4/transcription elongation factor Spt4
MSRWDNDKSQENTGSKKDDPMLFKIQGDKANICRIVNSDKYVKYLESWIMCDDNIKRPFIVGMEYYDEALGKTVWEWSPLRDILGDPLNFYRGGLLETVKGPNGKQSVWEDTPEVYNILFFNNDPVNKKQGSWEAKKKFAMEVLPRGTACDVDKETGEAFNWAVDNKHFKVLECGPMLFDSIATLRSTYGDVSDYDINCVRTGTDLTNTKYSAAKVDPTTSTRIASICKVGALTEEEKAYTHPDLVKRYAVASADYILEHLDNTLINLDTLTGRSDHLKISKQQTPSSSRASAPAAAKTPAQASAPVTAAQVPNAAPVEPVSTKIDAFDDSGIPDSPAKAAPVAQTGRVGRLAAKAAAPAKTVVCGYCQATIDANAQVCPSCNGANLVPCDDCGKPFSQWETTCPYCGKTY